MAIDFPGSPTLNQIFSSDGRVWRWDGQKWLSENASVASYEEVYDLTVLQNMETN